MRKAFGDDQIKVLYVKEGAFELGAPVDEERKEQAEVCAEADEATKHGART